MEQTVADVVGPHLRVPELIAAGVGSTEHERETE